jgi:hypothetical protein
MGCRARGRTYYLKQKSLYFKIRVSDSEVCAVLLESNLGDKGQKSAVFESAFYRRRQRVVWMVCRPQRIHIPFITSTGDTFPACTCNRVPPGLPLGITSCGVSTSRILFSQHDLTATQLLRHHHQNDASHRHG